MAAPSSHPRLGRFVMRTQGSRLRQRAAHGGLAALAVVAGVSAFLGATGWVRYVGVVPFLGVAIGLVVHGVRLRGRAISLHERGLLIRDARGRERAVTMEDVQGIAWARLEGLRARFPAHVHKLLVLTLGSGERLAVDHEVRRGDVTFDAVCERVARHVAERMEAALRHSGAVEWMPGVQICADALRLEAPRARRFDRPRALRHAFENGIYRLFFDASPEAVVEAAVDTRNLVPGMILVDRLWGGAQR